jgi:hypothetical protein
MRRRVNKIQKDNVTAQGLRSQKLEVRMKEPPKKYEEWVVWQKSHQFVLAAYSKAILNSGS